jgi:hypothetical protein
MITLIPLAVLALVALIVAVRPLRRYLIVRWLSDAVGNQALKRLPDQIHLAPSRPEALHDATAAVALAGPLLESGFDDAGTYSVVEMPGIFMRLLVKPDECFTAAVYEHPKAGTWLEITTRYSDGTTSSFSTMPASGLDRRPGSASVRMPGSSAAEVYENARMERPKGEMIRVTGETALGLLERGDAQSMAWRKKRRISAAEIAKVAERRKAA